MRRCASTFSRRVTLPVILAAAVDVAVAERPASPGRLAIFYGVPSLVNGASGDIERAAREFAPYDVVVFGDGLQDERAVEHRRTAEIIRRLAAVRPDTRVFGYIALGRKAGLSETQVADAIARWKDMGVRGVFLDEAGYDFGVTRARQIFAIDTAHAVALDVFVNAFNPDDVLAGDTHLRAGDLLLLESFIVRKGRVESSDRSSVRARSATGHARRTGVEVWAVTTPADDGHFDRRLCTRAWRSVVRLGFNGFGWGEPLYAASSSVMPQRDCRDPVR
jgi:hypothetical protein